MFWLGFIVSTCFIPGLTAALVPTQWAVLSALLPVGLWREGVFGPWHWAGLVLVAWSALSILWAPNTYDAFYGFWLFSIWALAFWYGSTVLDFEPLLKGLAAGLSVSALVALGQAFGLGWIDFLERPAGLFYNPTVLSAVCALAIIALTSHRLWLWLPGPIAGLILSGSRGGFFIIGATIIAKAFRWYISIPIIGIALASIAIHPTNSDILRLMNWGVTIHELDFFGHGVGSFVTYMYFNPTEHYHRATAMIHPGYTHNDYLQLWFELGPGAIVIYAIYAFCLTQRDNPWWSTMVAIVVLSFFYFPLYCPLTACIGCIAAGRIVGDWHCRWRRGTLGRPDYLLWLSPSKWLHDRTRSKAFPIPS